jgi:hypothetical protein
MCDTVAVTGKVYLQLVSVAQLGGLCQLEVSLTFL